MAATNTDTSWRFRETTKSGLMGTGGIGFTIGSSKSIHDLREQGTTQSGSFSTVGSTGGDVSITAGSALNSAVTTARDAASESDDRLAALKATKAALSGVQASQGVDLAQADGDPNNGIGVSLSLTSQKSKSEQHAQSDAVAGSTLNAGGNLAIS